MLSVDDWLAGGAVDALMIMQVHDELVFEVAEDAVDALIAGVRQRMSAAADLSVPPAGGLRGGGELGRGALGG